MKLICQSQGNSSAFGCAPRLAFPLWVLFPVGLCTLQRPSKNAGPWIASCAILVPLRF